ncbi:hypothetical protein BBJ28_00018932 [Nothophytophthora sp. Chile5]|nr:hypothetical protein BBJ28_00018932 [Nothophytophthora sp. Chile5]
MSERKLTGRQILELFYSEVGKADASPAAPNGGEGPGDGPAPDSRSLFRCKCGKIRAQRLKHGYTNLVQHVLVKHPEWLEAAAREAHPAPKPAVANSIKAPQEKADAPQSKAKTKAAAASTDESDVVPVRVDAEADAADVASDGSSGSSNGCSEADDSSAEETRTTTSLDPTPAPPTVSKRTDYLSWDDYFMSVASFHASRSVVSSSSQSTVRDEVLTCMVAMLLNSIVSPERKIVGIGYNGFPNGCNDDHLPWARESATASPLDTKYPRLMREFVSGMPIVRLPRRDERHPQQELHRREGLHGMSSVARGNAPSEPLLRADADVVCAPSYQIYVALFPCNECAKLIIQARRCLLSV